jgi:hypothetical protein
MGTPESKPAAKDTTEVLTMHPSWDSHANEENNSGVFFSLFNVHVSCIFSTFIFCFCIAISVLLAYLGYRRFCARPKSTSRPAATSRSIPLRLRFSTLEDKIEMEDFDEAATYGFTTQRHGPQQPNYASAPRYAQKQTRYGPQQPRYDNQRYNGGNFVDPVEQLRLLLQAVPIANAPVQPALAYQMANQLAQVHQLPPPAAQPAAPPPLNLGAAANANAAAANP